MADLKPEVKAKYKLAKDYPINGACPNFGNVDLSIIGLDSADQLFAAGFKGLELKEQSIKPKKE
jgi:hypothetical protein